MRVCVRVALRVQVIVAVIVFEFEMEFCDFEAVRLAELVGGLSNGSVVVTEVVAESEEVKLAVLETLLLAVMVSESNKLCEGIVVDEALFEMLLDGLELSTQSVPAPAGFPEQSTLAPSVKTHGELSTALSRCDAPSDKHEMCTVADRAPLIDAQ